MHQTMVVVSHRIRSLAWLDRFVLLDQGQIVATDTHLRIPVDVGR
jgi:ABC-type transport system involved in cytochrome bd biosynthesis fused ATPase/permease subunit